MLLWKTKGCAARTSEVTEVFLGRELAEEIFAYPNSYGGYQKLDTAAFFADKEL